MRTYESANTRTKKKKVKIMSEGVKAVGRETNKGLMDDQQWMAAGVRERLRKGRLQCYGLRRIHGATLEKG